jgi:hypothetical protein
MLQSKFAFHTRAARRKDEVLAATGDKLPDTTPRASSVTAFTTTAENILDRGSCDALTKHWYG